jgi:hypothetical protein
VETKWFTIFDKKIIDQWNWEYYYESMKVMIVPHVAVIGVYRVVSVDVYVLLNLTFSLVTLIKL